MRIGELTGNDLDYWAARAMGVPDEALYVVGGSSPSPWSRISIAGAGMFRPSTHEEDYQHATSGIKIRITQEGKHWVAHTRKKSSASVQFRGETPFVAGLRAFIHSVYGATVPE